MTHRVVYDTMVFFQWAAMPPGRLHGSANAVINGLVELCVSPALLGELRGLLLRPGILPRTGTETPAKVEFFVQQISASATIFQNVPDVFTRPRHTDDDHIFNLAIVSQAKYLVTWVTRILKLGIDTSADAVRLRKLAPLLEIVTPKQLADLLKT